MGHLHLVDYITYKYMTAWETELDLTTFSTSYQLDWIECIHASSTSVVRKISNSKHCPVEKPPNEISQVWNLQTHFMINSVCLTFSHGRWNYSGNILSTLCNYCQM